MNRRVVIAILLTALAARLAFALSLRSRIVQPDEGVYLTLARNIHDHGVLGEGEVPTADRPPALPFLIAGVYAVAGPRIPAARAAYAFLGVLAVWLIYGYGASVFGPRVAALAAAAAAAYPFFIYWSGVVMTETLTVCLVVAAVWRTHELIRAPSARAAAFSGLVWGLASLTRTQNIPMPFLAAPWLLRGPEKSSRAAATAVFLAAALLPPGLWALRNRAVAGSLTLDTHSGYTLIIRTMFHDEDDVDTGVADQALRKTEVYREAMALPPGERDRAFTRASLRFIRDNPGTYLRHCAQNFVQFWRFYPRLDKSVGVDGEFLHRDRRWFAVLSLATEPALILLAIVGAWFAASEGLAIALPCLFIGFTTLIHTFVIAQMRYRIPVMPFVILFAALAAVRLYDKWRPA